MLGAKMAMHSADVMTYLVHWLETASRGGISVFRAVAQDRVRFVCHRCQETYTCSTPQDTTIDFGIQQWVKDHSQHMLVNIWKGADAVPTGDMVWGDNKLIPLTADFKKIDDKPEMAKKIFDETLKFKGEMDAKVNDDAYFAKKIAELQAGDQGKAKFAEPKPYTTEGTLKAIPYETILIPKPPKFQENWNDIPKWSEEPETATDAELEQVEQAAFALKAIENAMKIKLLKAKIKDWQSMLPEEHEPAKPQPSEGGEILKIATGRKFR